MAHAWCRQVPSRWRSSDRVAVRGRSDSAEGGVDAEGAAAPPLMSNPAGTIYLVVCVCFLRPPRPKNIVVML
jgi:hypothetical protein